MKTSIMWTINASGASSLLSGSWPGVGGIGGTVYLPMRANGARPWRGGVVQVAERPCPLPHCERGIKCLG